MMLVTTVAPGPRSEGCLLAGARREIHPSSPEWSTPTGRELIARGVKTETDMLMCDKRALVPLPLEESALVPMDRIVPSRMVLVEKCDDEGNRFVKARLTARGRSGPRTRVPCQEPTNECSDGFHERQSGYSAGHSLLKGLMWNSETSLEHSWSQRK